jgi:hypothetical protein
MGEPLGIFSQIPNAVIFATFIIQLIKRCKHLLEITNNIPVPYVFSSIDRQCLAQTDSSS